MNILDPSFAQSSGIVMFLLGAVAAILIVRLIQRRRSPQRVVEQPNSHYTAQLARESATRHRWHTIDLDQVHEINRQEVIRLIDRADAAGVHTLNARERAFLDHMADLAAPPPERAPRPSAFPPQASPQPT